MQPALHDENDVYERRGETEEESEDLVKPKQKGTQGLIEIENPNLVKLKNIKVKDIDVVMYCGILFYNFNH